MEEIIRLIDAYWKFDNDQQHLSTWHDKQDLLEAIRQAKIWDKPAVSNSVCPDCMAFNKDEGKELTKCWNCGNEYRAN